MDYSSILTTTLLLLLTSCAQLRVSSVMGEAAGQSAPQLSKEVASKLIVAPSSPKTEEMAPPPSHVKLGKARVEQARISGQKSPNYHIIGSAKIRQSGKHQHKTYFLYGAEHLKLNNYYFDFPVVYNAAVKKWIDYFLTRGRGFFERYGSRAGRYAPLMGEILESRGLPRDLIFLAMAESGFQTHAKSWAKAVGPWQFMPYTGKRFGLKIDWYIDQRRDPIRSTIAAANYLTKLYGDFEAWELAAAAYNAGEGKIRRAIRRYRTESFWKLRKGRYLRSETKNYVPKIMALAIIGKNLAAFGMENLEFRQPLDFEEISVGPNVDLVNLAQALKVSFKELQRLNPEILRWFTPPNVEEYILRVPLGIATQWEECCKAVDLTAKAFQKYKVRGRRSTIRDVALKFKIKPYVLERLNGKTTGQRLKRNSYVLLPFRQGQGRRIAMYADLYERPRKSVLRRREYRKILKRARRRGKIIKNPTKYYAVKRGDTLWDVARINRVSLDTLIHSNYKLVKNRMIRAGDRLVVR